VSGGPGAGRGHRGDTLTKPKREKKPVSISGFKSSPSTTYSASNPPRKRSILPASSLIHLDADVGVDLGSTRRTARGLVGFIKPADVDAPPRDPQPPKKTDALSVVESSRAPAEQRKRSIDGPDGSPQLTDTPEDSSRKKRKR
jgi:hypothetical protein